MRILHTSDWHLGRSLYNKKRYEEFEAFLEWLILTIQEHKIDTLLVAGDVFDNGSPSNRAQNLYYHFLVKVASTSCQHIVVIAGNHDSPSFLNAPKELLRELNVYVIGSITESIEDEVLLLTSNNQPQAIICAVPYLRDRDVRVAEPGETIDDKNANLIEGISQHYGEVSRLAEQKREDLGNPKLPIIGMGHLFTAGGKTLDGDGVRELYIGALTHVHADKFPASFDYIALGHLHVPQIVDKKEHIRYSGSPLPIGFGEASQEKKVIIIEFSEGLRKIEEITVPVFQKLLRISGSIEDIIERIEELKLESAWLEIEYKGKDIIPNLRQVIDEALVATSLESLQIKNRQVMEKVAMAISADETLDDLDEIEVFNRCLDAFETSEEDRVGLISAYREILRDLQEEDLNAE
ncbi:exonuclease SbcCD subunit D C-terminal domain-containing protein [bacterium]|nr:exonuclease SbcCD subunit D C-terminal domain-containing protein [bacterium]